MKNRTLLFLLIILIHPISDAESLADKLKKKLESVTGDKNQQSLPEKKDSSQGGDNLTPLVDTNSKGEKNSNDSKL